jgi:hypothetical protein
MWRLLSIIIVIALFAPASGSRQTLRLARGIDRNEMGPLRSATSPRRKSAHVLVGMTSLTFALGSSSSTSASS